jgi:large conductance mechanosensitive channel
VILERVFNMTVRRGRTAATGFLQEFQQFIMKGNVVDLAVAVVVGGAFGKIVTSLIEDLITPALLNPAMKAANVEDLAQLQFNGVKYGSFLAAVLNFLVIAFVIFVLVHSLAKFKRQEEIVAETPAPDPVLESQQELTTALDRLTSTIAAQK